MTAESTEANLELEKNSEIVVPTELEKAIDENVERAKAFLKKTSFYTGKCSAYVSASFKKVAQRCRKIDLGKINLKRGFSKVRLGEFKGGNFLKIKPLKRVLEKADPLENDQDYLTLGRDIAEVIKNDATSEDLTVIDPSKYNFLT
ncbi:MAG: hypothetical protein HQM15_07355 [Deltaproteobacteria bacterium]|nr:hypothetical protein [Deltaproteobacteria bacterium]